MENERLDMQHVIIRALFDQRNWFAPLKRPKRILDIGCGTGKWCLEMGMLRRSHMNHIKLTPRSQGVSQVSGSSSACPYRTHLTPQQVEGIDLSPIQPDVYYSRSSIHITPY